MRHYGTSIAVAPVDLVREDLCFVEEASFAAALELAPIYHVVEKVSEFVEGEEASLVSAILHTCDHKNIED